MACGQVLPGHSIRIVDDAGQVVPERVEGRLEFCGPSATAGYWHAPALTARLFTDDVASRVPSLVGAAVLLLLAVQIWVFGLLADLLSGESVRPPYGGHPRLFIWGLLEARLQHADLMILGGLNEGVWPSLPAPDPWLAPRIRRESAHGREHLTLCIITIKNGSRNHVT